MSPVLISNGVEKQLPYSVSKDYVIRAKEDGVIEDIDEKTKLAIVKYKSGECEAINLEPQTVKNGAGGFYLSNKMALDYRKGQKFKKNDVLAHNTNFFSTGYDGCKFSIGTLCKVACMSSFATYEDSKLITSGLSKRLSTEMIMNKHVILGQNATVSYIAKKGDPIKVGEDLIRYEQSNTEEAVNQMLKNIGDDLQEEIKSLGKTSLTSKYTGVIEDIRIYSTYELNELSPSLAKIVGDYWKEIKAKKNLIKKYGITEPEDSGNTFFLNDGVTKPDSKDRIKGYKVETGGVIIEFYIKFNDPVGVGDKLTFANGLKGVCSAIIPKGKEAYSEYRKNEAVSAFLTSTGVAARMVVSGLLNGYINKGLIELSRQIQEELGIKWRPIQDILLEGLEDVN